MAWSGIRVSTFTSYRVECSEFDFLVDGPCEWQGTITFDEAEAEAERAAHYRHHAEGYRKYCEFIEQEGEADGEP